MTTREALHRLRDSIPADDLDRARQALEPRGDPVLLALANAPLDDEPETDEERAAVAEAEADLAAGNVVTLEEVRRELRRERHTHESGVAPPERHPSTARREDT